MAVVAESTRAPAGAPRSISEQRAQFREGKAALLTHFRESRPTAPAATRLVRALARHVDQTLLELWEHAMMPPGAALVAVGGYGRAELYPHSDVDVLVLLPPGDQLDNARLAGSSNDALKSSIEGFFRRL